jgi:hypothetical protein
MTRVRSFGCLYERYLRQLLGDRVQVTALFVNPFDKSTKWAKDPPEFDLERRTVVYVRINQTPTADEIHTQTQPGQGCTWKYLAKNFREIFA